MGAPPTRETPRYTLRAPHEQWNDFFLKMTLAGQMQRQKDNEKLIQKASTVKREDKNEVGPAIDPADTPRVSPMGAPSKGGI